MKNCKKILDWPKSPFGFFHMILWKNLNVLVNPILEMYQRSNHGKSDQMKTMKNLFFHQMNKMLRNANSLGWEDDGKGAVLCNVSVGRDDYNPS